MAVQLVHAGRLPLDVLFAIATEPERIQAALILGRPGDLPAGCRTPALAFRRLNAQQQRLVHQLGPLEFTRTLPPAPPASKIDARQQAQQGRKARPPAG